MEINKPYYRTPFFDSLSKLRRDAIVFSEGRKSVLAGELYENSIALANGLRKKGFEDKQRIVLIVPPGKEFLEIFFAANMLKGVLAIIDPEMGRDNYESKLKQFDARWIFIDSRLLLLKENPLLRYLYLKFSKHPFYFSFKTKASIIATGKRLPLFGNFLKFDKLYSKPTQAISFEDCTDEEFMVTYTSGTLAEPKGVVHSVNSLLKSLTKIKEIVGSAGNSRIAAYLPHFLLFGICSGKQVFLFKKDKGAESIITFFEKNKITTLFGPPSFYLPLIHSCKNQSKLLPSSLQLIILGSAPVHPKFLETLYE